MALTPEGRVKAAVKRVLDRFGAWWYMPVSNGMGRVGCPDFIVCLPYTVQQEDVGRQIGVFVALETKAPGQCHKTTANQDREIFLIRRAGGVAEVVDDDLKAETILAAPSDGWYLPGGKGDI